MTAPTRISATPPAPARPRWHSRSVVARWLETSRVQYTVIAVILVNAIVLGLETVDPVTSRFGDVLGVIDRICLTIFVIELALKLYAHRLRFFRTGWNVFDLLVVGIALIPGSGGFGVLRALRVLRVLRLVSMVPALRRVVDALVRAIPGMLSIGALLALLFYVAAVMSTMLFGEAFPAEFGSLPASLLSLFQVMTLDNWSPMVRDVMAVHPWAPAFFVPFVLLSAFAVLNLFIAVIVDAMQHMRDEPVLPPSDTTEGAVPTIGPADPAGSAEPVTVRPATAESLATQISALQRQVEDLTAAVHAQQR